MNRLEKVSKTHLPTFHNWWSKSSSSTKTVLKLIPIFLILAAIPITVGFLQYQQNLTQKASTPAELEAENGVLGQNTQIVTDTNASGGKSILFATSTPTPTPAPTQSTGSLDITGFGKNTVGGTGQPIYHVTNLNDSGTGSLRDALSQGNRYIVFDVSGTIAINSQLYVGGNFITLDGTTAPSPGITLTGHTLYLQNNIHDIILKGFRHRGGWQGGQEADSITIARGVYNVVIDHVSVSGYFDEGIDIWDNCHDITIQNSIFGVGGNSSHNYLSLVGKQSRRITYYRNLFYKGEYRQPAIGHDDNGILNPSEITGDVVNNLIWDFTAYGTTVYWNGWANVIGNYYYSSTQNGSNRAIQIETGGKGYSSLNYSKNGASVAGNTSTPFSVPSYAVISATDACTAANYVKANSGSRPLDSTDSGYIDSLNITCN